MSDTLMYMRCRELGTARRWKRFGRQCPNPGEAPDTAGHREHRAKPPPLGGISRPEPCEQAANSPDAVQPGPNG
eukprot:4232054-Alexandrium_andersonii.AAC.1